MKALWLSLIDTLSPISFNTNPYFDKVSNDMNQMAIAMSMLGTLENFLEEADLLRQQTLQQMHRIPNTPMEIVIPIIPDKTTNMLIVIDSDIGMTKFDHENHLGTFIHSDTKSLETIAVDDDVYVVDQFDVKSNSTLEEFRLQAYVHHLENSRLNLIQLEQEPQRGLFSASGYLGNIGLLARVNGILAFDMEYARWLDQHQNQISNLRSAFNSQADDEELRLLVDGLMSHYDVVFNLKSISTSSDVFHMLSGLWTTPVERCFMWLGGFRSSKLLKMLVSHLEPLTDQQLICICNLQQSSQQAEDALSQGMKALQLSLTDTWSPISFNTNPCSDNVANYMNQMAITMSKLGT
ncbi:hypothetical protein IEQ34_014623 [Dendrobium chrysotoxum]|uniref:DOG1 domain-containing protein n=1 Tax=Dendrobium chrysotoxum TaxID=161865 RepID=A0AAV7GJS9_DENCH|nr:hypothetical protein IEQ34_014623 [Dendrobium chrysotoxum]